MERSTNQQRLLKQKHMIHILIFLSLLLGKHTQGEESSCEVTVNGTCVQRVTGEIKGKFLNEKRPFTVYHKPPNADQEVAALFSFVLSYHCQATGEYVCDEEIINNTFSVSIKPGVSCKEGNFTFFTDGGQPIVCQKIKSERTEVDTKREEAHATDQSGGKENASKKWQELLHSCFTEDEKCTAVVASVVAVYSLCFALSASITLIISRHKLKMFVKIKLEKFLLRTRKPKRKEQANNISISSEYKAVATADTAEI